MEIPTPLVNYLYLIRYRRSPYYDIVRHLLADMEMHYLRAGMAEVVYTVNPRVLQEAIEERMKSGKVTTVTICRTILAFLRGANLEQDHDFYVTTTYGGKKNYHIYVNLRTLKSLKSLL